MSIGNDFFGVICVERGGLEKNTSIKVANIESTEICSLSKLNLLVIVKKVELDTYHSKVDGLPSFILQLLRDLDKQVPVFRSYHLLIDQTLIASLIHWHKRELLSFSRIHTIDIDVY
jgi:hypothetical protein